VKKRRKKGENEGQKRVKFKKKKKKIIKGGKVIEFIPILA
jgi:predicted nuclease of restriction endonuclease-like (RecB) superfamily